MNSVGIIGISGTDVFQERRLIMVVKKIFEEIIIRAFYLAWFVSKHRIKAGRPLNILGGDVKFPYPRVNEINYLSKVGCVIRIKIFPFLNTHCNCRFIVGLTNVAGRYRKICAKTPMHISTGTLITKPGKNGWQLYRKYYLRC